MSNGAKLEDVSVESWVEVVVFTQSVAEAELGPVALEHGLR